MNHECLLSAWKKELVFDYCSSFPFLQFTKCLLFFIPPQLRKWIRSGYGGHHLEKVIVAGNSLPAKSIDRLSPEQNLF